MSKKPSERKMHLLVLAFSTGLFLGVNFSFIATAGEPAHKYLDYFHQVYQLITTDYVDEPDNKSLFYGAIKGMLNSLGDPFTRFLDEKASADLKEMTTGKFVGIGVEIAIRDGEIVIVAPIENSPAIKAGLEAGDVITQVNGEKIKGKKFDKIIKEIKGLPGTKVKIEVRREGFDENLPFNIERAPIKIKSVEYAVIAEKNSGYLKIKTFGNETVPDVKKALKFFKSKNINNLVIDLRYNPGGLLTAAVDISDYFLDKGKRIVSTKGRLAQGRETVFTAKSPMYYSGNIIVLVNRGSASASEILSGALRDNDRAKLLGEKTFGKGSVQKTYSLDKEIGVAVTIAKYYTPSGAMIHKKGIKPDYAVKYFDIPKSDEEALKQISKEKILTSFVSIKTAYDSKTREQFKKILSDKKINLSQKTADYLLKREAAKYHKRKPYDVEFDNQLISALEKLDKK